MESRRPLRNKRSKIKKKLGTEFIELPGEKEIYAVKYRKKEVTTKKCKWCGQEFDKERFFCCKCRSCQYCGIQIMNRNACQCCGNTQGKHDSIKVDKIIIY